MSKQTNKDYILHRVVTESMQTNCYIFGSARTKEVALIDPGGDYKRIKEILDREGLTPKLIINTHGHIDHIGANYKFKLPICVHNDDADFLTNPVENLSAFYGHFAMSPKASRILQDGDVIDISGIKLKVLHTPGHTPGGISLHYDGIVFTGDTLFGGGVGRTDFPYSNHDDLISSIKYKLMRLDDDTIVLPGHGSDTTIGAERRTNPWL